MRTAHLCARPRVIYSQRKLSCLDERVLYPGQLRVFSIHVAVHVLQGLEVEVQPGEDPLVLILCLIECSFVRRDNIHYVDPAKARETSQS